METGNIPGCTYSRPQVASVGFTEAKAKESGYKVKVGKFPFIGNGKAIALGEAEGFIKTCSTKPPASCWARTWSARK
jgi:dihydrolipoamide dehydrogenase